MVDTLLIYAGKEETMPGLAYRQLGYCYDSKKLYIGGAGEEGNILIGSVVWETDINALKNEMRSKLTAEKAESIGDLSTDADISAVVTGFNSLLAVLRTAGIMNNT